MRVGKAESNGVGCSEGHFSKSARSGAPPVISVNVKRQTRVILRRYTHRNPVKRGLVERPEKMEVGQFSLVLYGKVGAVRVNYQEWPLEIERRPVEKFNDESRPPRPLIRKNRE